MGFRNNLVTKVPGFRNTDTARKIAMDQYLEQYRQLLTARKNLETQIYMEEESLGLHPGKTSNIDEVTRETSRIHQLEKELEIIYKKGMQDPT